MSGEASTINLSHLAARAIRARRQVSANNLTRWTLLNGVNDLGSDTVDEMLLSWRDRSGFPGRHRQEQHARTVRCSAIRGTESFSSRATLV